MTGSGRVFVAGLVLLFCAAAAGVAFAVEKEPVSGGILSLPGVTAPAPTAAAPRETPAPPAVPAETRTEDDTAWGVLLRGGYFGLPNAIADKLFLQHPEVSGSSVGAEIRYHGKGGGRGGESIGLAIDSASCSANGVWQEDESDTPETGEGEINMLAVTLTGYWSLFPSWYVHPYGGIGIGVAHATGHYQNQSERQDADYWIPVLHIPVGLAAELGKRFQLAVEARFIDGIAIGGALQVRF